MADGGLRGGGGRGGGVEGIGGGGATACWGGEEEGTNGDPDSLSIRVLVSKSKHELQLI